MHLKNPLLFGLMAILLLAGTITPGFHKVSLLFKNFNNEVETIPWFELEFVNFKSKTPKDIDLVDGQYLLLQIGKLEIPRYNHESNSFGFTHVNFGLKTLVKHYTSDKKESN
ncbi:MAG: hypothetical protein Ct9H300mP17_11190 [Candidatus Nitrosopelagicus sp.]|nr:MAG: hypothetical protein Ct9H300mP17_11190 [Candidatus Nitrosopelagicus sp.]